MKLLTALAVKEVDQLNLFLDDIIPQPVKLKQALKNRREQLEQIEREED
jgi:hypothetical protein